MKDMKDMTLEELQYNLKVCEGLLERALEKNKVEPYMNGEISVFEDYVNQYQKLIDEKENA